MHLIWTGTVSKVWKRYHEKYEILSCSYQRGVLEYIVGLSIANRLYPTVLLQFLFPVVPCVFA